LVDLQEDVGQKIALVDDCPERRGLAAIGQECRRDSLDYATEFNVAAQPLLQSVVCALNWEEYEREPLPAGLVNDQIYLQVSINRRAI
jgi:hypothetical protein